MAASDDKQTSRSSAATDSNSNNNSSSSSKTPTAGNSGGASSEFEPPLACVRRMLKNTLPSNTNVGKDASTAFSRACGIFVIYLTACANDFARESKRQTITATDIMAAIKVSVQGSDKYKFEISKICRSSIQVLFDFSFIHYSQFFVILTLKLILPTHKRNWILTSLHLN